jgi:hypothetical protein
MGRSVQKIYKTGRIRDAERQLTGGVAGPDWYSTISKQASLPDNHFQAVEQCFQPQVIDIEGFTFSIQRFYISQSLVELQLVNHSGNVFSVGNDAPDLFEIGVVNSGVLVIYPLQRIGYFLA